MKTLTLLIIILFTPLNYADNNLDFFGVTLENDFFFNEDGLYSNGLIATWGYDDIQRLDEQALPDWLAYVAQKSYLNAQQDKRYAITYRVAQLMQTAIDDSVAELVTEDAPYVGMLAWQGQLSAYDTITIDRLSLILGMVGPVTGTKFTQAVVHHLRGASDTKGWENQLSNEFIFRLQAERLWRIYDKTLGNTEFDTLTGINGGFGTLRSDLGVGIGFRWGQDLHSNFSSASAFPMQKLNRPQNSPDGWYLFANASALYVANDIFMDGNTFQDSHSVDIIRHQYGASVGLMANIYNWNFLFTVLRLSEQYQGQNERSRFGSLSVTYYF
ncbi:lipid A deacylase LpxR family protein [Psychromonas antarctica]|uniref:lipid A deacylase LpxR family protein n=1 Tax=Psychromonas antarctica TaxID=67573 RepID=UPI001EE822DF|nr:lipid A deacylase LpxR family protein [Psychromonas antarctica]MCG6202142.1 lipid A deacylase LpxR family protein [Psychromonas antarctica]